MLELTDADRAAMEAAWNATGSQKAKLRRERIYRAGLAAGIERTKDVARLAIAYDSAIQACANSPDAMSSHCTAEGDTLDDLYAAWISAARALLK
jgi:hypothetical protein